MPRACVFCGNSDFSYVKYHGSICNICGCQARVYRDDFEKQRIFKHGKLVTTDAEIRLSQRLQVAEREYSDQHSPMRQKTGMGYKACVVCNTLFKKKSNSQKYCKECAPKVRRQQNQENARKYRKNSKQIENLLQV